MKFLALFLLLLASCAPTSTDRVIIETSRPASRRGRGHHFHVRVTATPVTIRHDLALKEIARLPGAAGSGLKTQGLTTLKHSLATHTRFSTTNGTREVYAWFDDVILEVSISSDIIHIPKEYPRGSCEYEAVLQHERGHGRVARDKAVELAGNLENALATTEGLPTRFDPVISADFASAAERLKQAVAKVTDPVYDQYEKDEKRAQAALDRPDPYDAVYKRCTGWR